MVVNNSTSHLKIPKLNVVPEATSNLKKFKVKIDATIEAEDIGHALLKLADYYYEIAYDSEDVEGIYLSGEASVHPC
ncbi:hypothetical protein [Flavobacterium sp.]|jgi:hypothetical protein|uniref:hypothetical protein n=1 Tax=Flavobacterium sp. TaxID=239 RepID=UPI0037BEAE97